MVEAFSGSWMHGLIVVTVRDAVCVQRKLNGNVTFQNFEILNNCRENMNALQEFPGWMVRTWYTWAEPFLRRRHIQAPKGSQHYYSKKQTKFCMTSEITTRGINFWCCFRSESPWHPLLYGIGLLPVSQTMMHDQPYGWMWRTFHGFASACETLGFVSSFILLGKQVFEQEEGERRLGCPNLRRPKSKRRWWSANLWRIASMSISRSIISQFYVLLLRERERERERERHHFSDNSDIQCSNSRLVNSKGDVHL